MAETSPVKQYFQKCFDKKLLIQKAIIAAIAAVIVISLSLSFYMWLKDSEGVIGETNPFWYLEVVWNDGIAFSALSGNFPAIYAIQSIMFLVLLGVYLFLTHDKFSSSFIALAMMGGLFNLFQRVGAPANHANMVLDYFKFGFMKFATFNWPDTFVVIGIFGFIISYITVTIIQARKEN